MWAPLPSGRRNLVLTNARPRSILKGPLFSWREFERFRAAGHDGPIGPVRNAHGEEIYHIYGSRYFEMRHVITPVAFSISYRRGSSIPKLRFRIILRVAIPPIFFYRLLCGCHITKPPHSRAKKICLVLKKVSLCDAKKNSPRPIVNAYGKYSRGNGNRGGWAATEKFRQVFHIFLMGR